MPDRSAVKNDSATLCPRRPRRLRIALLSRKESLYTTRRLVQAIRARGHLPVVIDPLACSLFNAPGGPEIFLKG
ncbi:MAG: 30S ribosomal protein S6--L-glutamate ligase, partial [Myxococcaceae bacterium]|nr:30S ribosomal protein S6--L-glutamate ligase [Myxococcaceae bacterium]